MRISDPATWTLDPATWLQVVTAEERWELDCAEFTAEEVRHGRADRLLMEAEIWGCRKRLDAVVVALDTLDPALLHPDFFRRTMLLKGQLTGRAGRPGTEERDGWVRLRYREVRYGGLPRPWEFPDDGWHGRKPVAKHEVALAEVMAEFGIGYETARRIVREGARAGFLDDLDSEEDGEG